MLGLLLSAQWFGTSLISQAFCINTFIYLGIFLSIPFKILLSLVFINISSFPISDISASESLETNCCAISSFRLYAASLSL